MIDWLSGSLAGLLYSCLMACWPGRSLCGFVVAWLAAYVAGLLCRWLAGYGGPMAVASWVSSWLAQLLGSYSMWFGG